MYKIGDTVEFWLTKYALTSGVRKMAGEVVRMKNGLPETVFVKSSLLGSYYHLADFELTESAALRKLGMLRIKEIERLKNKISQLETMKLEVKG